MKVNGKEVEFKDGETITALLARMAFVFPLILVYVNGKLVDRDAYDSTFISSADIVEVIHLMSGG